MLEQNHAEDGHDHQITMQGATFDERVAPLVADILNDTPLNLMATSVRMHEDDEDRAPSAEFVFPDSDEASAFMAIVGTVMPEARTKYEEVHKKEVSNEGWGIYPFLMELDAYIVPTDEDGDVDESVDPEDYELCDCDNWHVGIGLAVGVPLDKVDEIAKLVHTYIREDEDRPDLRTEFEGIAGLDEFF